MQILIDREKKNESQLTIVIQTIFASSGKRSDGSRGDAFKFSVDNRLAGRGSEASAADCCRSC